MLKNYNSKIILIRRTPLANITSESIVWVNDVFDQDELCELLRNQIPAYIVNDSFVAVEPSKYHIYCAPLFLAQTTRDIVKNFPEYQNYQTQHIFNFTINQKRVNRFLCMKLVEMFELSNYDYTWSGVDQRFDMTDILNELASLGENSPMSAAQQSFLLSETKIAPRFFGDTQSINESHMKVSPSNSENWNHGLNNIFCGSVVSLITEPLAFQKSTVFTDKTAYAILGKTFPLWIGGGVGQAQRFKEMGFDVFDDVIDHNYQHCNTLIERCYYAFKNNLHILSDYKYASKIRESMMDRLEHNQWLLKNKHVDNFCKKQIEQWPEDLQHNISNELKVLLEE